jgi:tetratricopeptide (TPR) repeat protein
MQGDVEARGGRREEAVRKYQAAVARGETRMRIWRNLAQLLFDLRRYSEAAALLQRVSEPDILKGHLGQLSATLILVNPEEAGDSQAKRKRALQIASKTMQTGSGGYRDQLWLAQLASMAGDSQEAEKALRKAHELAPQEPVTWVALVALLARNDRERARKEVAEAEKVLKTGRNVLALVACHELVGQDREAQKAADQAVRQQPGDPVVPGPTKPRSCGGRSSNLAVTRPNPSRR